MIIVAWLLLLLGITVIYSSNPTLAIQQLVFAIVGTGFYFLLKSLDYRSLKISLKPIYIITLILLIITLILGIESRGSVRWITLGPFNFQPSEFAKPVLILILANFWSKNIASWKNIGGSLLICLPFFILIFQQPDLGTTLTVIFIWLAMLFAANISFVKSAFLILAAVIITPLGWFLLQDYQKARIFSFLSPTNDPQGIGFHVIQSMIAVGSGQFFGRGLGRGTQSRLQFLPEFRTDFIFAFIAEELGFLGSSIVLLFYALLFYLLFRLLSKTGDRFGELIIVGVFGMIFFQTAVNIAMNVGLLPITGITLPLLSYGGSSVVTTLMSLGLVASVSKFGLKLKEIDRFG